MFSSPTEVRKDYSHLMAPVTQETKKSLVTTQLGLDVFTQAHSQQYVEGKWWCGIALAWSMS